ncbi:hypothetical protein Slin14017_G042960 [Septoria linicola]|nr:hypothetical protein Slin14017_G042960 [Septoria linicola]
MSSVLTNDILSDADFDAWLSSVRSQLSALGLVHTIGRVNAATEDESVSAAIHISGLTQPRLLLRVPSAELLNAAKLVEHLRLLTRPFRFTDLPPELRNRIYDQILPHTDGIKHFVQLSDLEYVPFGYVPFGQSISRKRTIATFDMPAVAKVSK